MPLWSRAAHWLRSLLCILLTYLAVLPGARGAATNRTIDDEYGDSVVPQNKPVYLPSDRWAYGPGCPSCGINKNLNVSDAGIFMGSWHDTTADPGNVTNITLSFTGTAIWVFCIIPNFAGGITTTANFTFQLDGMQRGTYFHFPDSSSSTVLYNQPVFSATGLGNTPHSLVMSPTAGPGPDISQNSLMLFDYAIYTYEDDVGSSATITAPAGTAGPTTTSAPSTSSGTPLGAILGGSLGGAALVLLTAIFFVWRRQQHRRSTDKLDALVHGRLPHGETWAEISPGAPPGGGAVHAGALYTYGVPGSYGNPASYGGATYGACPMPLPYAETSAPSAHAIASGKTRGATLCPQPSGSARYSPPPTPVRVPPSVAPPSSPDSRGKPKRGAMLALQAEDLQVEVGQSYAEHVHQTQDPPPAYSTGKGR